MNAVSIDFILSGLIYIVLIYFMIRLSKKKRNSDNDDDNDGGISIAGPPKIDLPPGVCLPDDPIRRIKEEPEEIYV
ncbi:MAG: hypothetical protein O2887_16360 [Bacteroidetes bacterium]|nr:hypothetical protein [Bacteroidota bacterium]MDA1122037.1 hypothetical protein [Bacteroidota bacterium]